MAITTYSELQTAIANWTDRSDLTDRIPEFIDLAEAQFIRRIKHWRMEKRATTTASASSRTVQVPSDFISMRNLKVNSSTVDVLEFLPPSALYENSSGTGVPKYYTVQGNQLALEPIPASDYTLEMDYYAFTALSDANPTNWLLTYFPDAYLYASLLQAEAFIINDKRIPVWKLALEEVYKELKRDDHEARWNGTPLIIRNEA